MSKDIVGENQTLMEFDEGLTIVEFRSRLTQLFPGLDKMRTYSIAINEVYAEESQILTNNDTLAIIPPVSGG